RVIAVVIAVVAAGWIHGPSGAAAQSLWQNRSPNRVFLVRDTQAREVGDLITIVIRENTDVANRDSRQFDRSSSSAGGFSLGAASSGDFGRTAGEMSFDSATNGSGSFDGQSAYDVAREFSDRITVCVKSKLPNGNMIVEGRRTRFVSGEQRTLLVSGVVRPLDVAPDNTVLSQYVADFMVQYEGDGDESRFTKQGWATRMWNRIRPF
ncbi:MAG: flagellar basal body L-ring protein FlgH, partial [Planctomycetales bacterium]|nr:flagellar basal body L-ring protein FlgH [Planctomycetales bacterium]